MFDTEHRYYGESSPNDSSASADLSFLSSRQAVRDIVEFVKSPDVQRLIMKQASDPTAWITFGGSYAGALATWSRLLHPETIFGAVSNSAPLQQQLEFPEYNDGVGRALEDEFIGGSTLCRSIVEEGHAQVVDTFDSAEEDLNRVATLFNVCGGSNVLRLSKRNLEVSTFIVGHISSSHNIFLLTTS